MLIVCFWFKKLNLRQLFSVDVVPSMVRILLAGQQFILFTKHLLGLALLLAIIKRTGRPRTAETVVEKVTNRFAQSPRKSTRRFSCETGTFPTDRLAHTTGTFALVFIPIGRGGTNNMTTSVPRFNATGLFWGSLKIECTFSAYLLISLSSKTESPPQLR
ncbi:hypothetical protein C0J52_21613 [Blattella germanica]|nr:hypothetical protein C0J52_21613 [Blattella germanica]